MADQVAIPEGPLTSTESITNPLDTSVTITDAPPVDNSDTRSSSLSDYDEGYEDDNDINKRDPVLRKDEVDSEAETERLDITPHHPKSLGNDALAFRNEHTKTPSKIQNNYDAMGEHEQDSTPSSASQGPIALENGTTSDDANLGTSRPSSHSDLLRQSENALAGRKRKRRSERDQLGDGESESEKPAEKHVNSVQIRTLPEARSIEAEEQAEDEFSEEDSKELDNETSLAKRSDNQAPSPALLEQQDEREPPRKAVKSKKGKRKGKYAIESAFYEGAATQGERGGIGDPSTEAVEDLSPEGEGEEADAVARSEEELLKKRAAIDALAGIEEHFTSFRERLFEEKINQVDRELAQLHRPNPTHPEYLSMMKCIDARYESQVQLEDKLLGYKLNTLEVQTVAERSIIHSQYYQTVRDLREDVLEEIGAEIFRLQKERRQAGDEPEYNYLYEPNRPQQIVRQAKVNQEVSLLGGIKKYKGFPAAPRLNGLRETEIDDDLRAMKINSNPAAPLPRQVNESIPSDKRAAEEFFAQTPWANPQHPAHQQGALTSQTSRLPNPFTTPAPQRRMFDGPHLPNGSGSTIAIPSDPPSSAFAPGGSSVNHHSATLADVGHGLDSTSHIPTSIDNTAESPLSQLKRNPPHHHHHHHHHHHSQPAAEPNRADEPLDAWALRRIANADHSSPMASIKDHYRPASGSAKGHHQAADTGAAAVGRDEDTPRAFKPSTPASSIPGVKTEEEAASAAPGGALGFAMPAGHGRGQARQVGIAAGGFGR
ncbi:MAG: hypothetical protein M1822_000230 [Bathelium mastoideum]|nr:MAG: hypothetical protein M1822_000230 [Bathelium mastoideum]